MAEASRGAREWGHNPVTGEIAHILAGLDESGGNKLVVELWLHPGAAVAGAHTHPALIERFEVLEGEVTFLVGDRERPMRTGDDRAEVQVGVVHDWWNSGVGIARVWVEVEAAPDAPAGTAGRFVAMIETLWSLGALGEVNDAGMPDPLWLATIAHEYRDVIRFTSPPRLVQTSSFRPWRRPPGSSGAIPPTRPCTGPRHRSGSTTRATGSRTCWPRRSAPAPPGATPAPASGAPPRPRRSIPRGR